MAQQVAEVKQSLDITVEDVLQAVENEFYFVNGMTWRGDILCVEIRPLKRMRRVEARVYLNNGYYFSVAFTEVDGQVRRSVSIHHVTEWGAV